MRREHHLLSPTPAVQLVTVGGGADVEDDGGSMWRGGLGRFCYFLSSVSWSSRLPTKDLWREGGLVAW